MSSIYLFACLLIFQVLSRETSRLAFLLILPELICFAGKEYACAPDPMPECIPLATKIKEKQKGKIDQSCTGKELNCIKPNLPRSCVTFDSCQVLSLARSICLMAPWATPNAMSWVSTHIQHSQSSTEPLLAPHLTGLEPDWVQPRFCCSLQGRCTQRTELFELHLLFSFFWRQQITVLSW